MSFENGENPVSVGPWGGQGGNRWDDGVYSTIRQLVIVHGACIDSIQIEYDDKGNSIWSMHGGSGGNKTDKVKLGYPDEFLTSIRGHYGYLNERGTVFVRSLTLESNRKTYGPFGVEQGTYFSFLMTGSKIVGFHGKSGWYIDAIGAYFKPLHKSNPSTSVEFSDAEDKAKVEVDLTTSGSTSILAEFARTIPNVIFLKVAVGVNELKVDKVVDAKKEELQKKIAKHAAATPTHTATRGCVSAIATATATASKSATATATATATSTSTSA